MSAQKHSLDHIISTFSPSLGLEKASNLIKSASLKAGLPIKKTYSNDEVLKIYEVLNTTEKGFIRSIAGQLISKLILDTKNMPKIIELITNLQRSNAKLEEWSKNLTETAKERTQKLEQAYKIASDTMLDLEKANSYVEAILNNLLDTLIVTDTDGIINKVNNITLTILGYKQEELVGKHIRLISDEEILVKKILQEEQVKNHEINYKKKDGELVQMLFSGAVMKDKEGKVIGIVDAAKDITERKKIEEELIHEKDFSKSIVDTAQTIILILDNTGKIVHINKYMEKISGHRLDEVKGKDWFEIFLPERNRNSTRELFKKAIEGIQTKGNIEAIIKKDGSELEIEWYDKSLKDNNGNIIGLVAIGQDITERKMIRENEIKYRKLFEDAKDAIFIMTGDIFVDCNDSTLNMFGVTTREQIIGQPPYRFSPLLQPDGRDSKEKALEKINAALQGQPQFFEWEHSKIDGTTFITEVSLNRVEIQNKIYIQALVRDISKRKEIEKGLEKNRLELTKLASELKHAVKVKSEFLANMSHELRTPLNSINGFSEVLFDETFGPLNEKQKKYASNILTSGKHLLLLINQVLDMAKVEAGKMTLTLSNLSIKTLITDIAMLVGDMAAKKKIEMLLEIAEDLPNIEADDLKVREIFYNLISNAIKFTPNDGKISIRAKKTDSVIEIVIWDNGCGIAPKNIEKIFEGFIRIDTPYSRVTEGTGLGLPLSKKLVELHGGEFFIESAGLNKGTSVRFTLPITQKNK